MTRLGDRQDHQKAGHLIVPENAATEDWRGGR
jgi:hypothetical protein